MKTEMTTSDTLHTTISYGDGITIRQDNDMVVMSLPALRELRDFLNQLDLEEGEATTCQHEVMERVLAANGVGWVICKQCGCAERRDQLTF